MYLICLKGPTQRFGNRKVKYSRAAMNARSTENYYGIVDLGGGRDDILLFAISLKPQVLSSAG